MRMKSSYSGRNAGIRAFRTQAKMMGLIGAGNNPMVSPPVKADIRNPLGCLLITE